MYIPFIYSIIGHFIYIQFTLFNKYIVGHSLFNIFEMIFCCMGCHDAVELACKYEVCLHARYSATVS